MQTHSTPKLVAFFVASTLISAALAIGAVIFLKDSLQSQVQTDLLPIIGNVISSNKVQDLAAENLVNVRERVLPSLFPVSNRTTAIGITSDGYLLTTLPLAADALFTIAPGKSVPAKEIMKDESLGLAIVKVDATRLPVARFVASAFVAPGTEVHIAAHEQIENSVIATTTTLTHRVGQTAQAVQATDLLRRFKAASVFAPAGSVAVSSDGILGILVDPTTHLVLPSDAFTPMLNRFLKTKTISHPTLAVELDVTSLEATTLDRGVIIKSVKRASTAEKAGLKPGDIILAVEGESVEQDRPLAELLEQFDPSNTVTLTISRDGKTSDINVLLAR